MRDKRTKAQLDFDMAKHGWAFCNQAMLAHKVERLDELIKALSPTDDRHDTLRTIKSYLKTES